MGYRVLSSGRFCLLFVIRELGTVLISNPLNYAYVILPMKYQSNRNCLKVRSIEAKYTHKNLLNQFVTDFSILLDRRFKSNNK